MGGPGGDYGMEVSLGGHSRRVKVPNRQGAECGTADEAGPAVGARGWVFDERMRLPAFATGDPLMRSDPRAMQAGLRVDPWPPGSTGPPFIVLCNICTPAMHKMR